MECLWVKFNWDVHHNSDKRVFPTLLLLLLSELFSFLSVRFLNTVEYSGPFPLLQKVDSLLKIWNKHGLDYIKWLIFGWFLILCKFLSHSFSNVAIKLLIYCAKVLNFNYFRVFHIDTNNFRQVDLTYKCYVAKSHFCKQFIEFWKYVSWPNK